MMYPIILPIYHSSENAKLGDYIYPGWVDVLLAIAIMAVVLGILLLLLSCILDFCFYIDCETMFKVSLFSLLSGAMLIIITLVCFFCTATPVDVSCILGGAL